MTFNNEFYKKYDKAINYYNKAQTRFLHKEYEDCLANCRRCLESILQLFCKDCGIDLTGLSIENMIDTLKEKEIFTREECGILHNARKLGNLGAHVNSGDETPTQNDADKALDELEKALKLFESKYNPERFSSLKESENIPMQNPDYFSLNRKYRGIFANVFNINQLKIDDTYKKLYAAAEGGDIQAMLDLAIAFLPKEFKGKYAINDNQLFNFPMEHNNDNQDYAYDTRYYYWLIRAANATCNRWNFDKRDKIPYKYISTALYEVILYSFYAYEIELFYKAKPRIERNRPVFVSTTEFVEAWYDEDKTEYGYYLRHFNKTACELILIKLMEKYGKNIIDGSFGVSSVNDIKYIYACSCYCIDLKMHRENTEKCIKFEGYPAQFAINSEDEGKFVSKDLLYKYCNQSRLCNKYYNSIINFEEKIIQERREQEEQKRQEEEQKRQQEELAKKNEIVNKKAKKQNKKVRIIIIAVIVALVIFQNVFVAVLKRTQSNENSTTVVELNQDKTVYPFDYVEVEFDGYDDDSRPFSIDVKAVDEAIKGTDNLFVYHENEDEENELQIVKKDGDRKVIIDSIELRFSGSNFYDGETLTLKFTDLSEEVKSEYGIKLSQTEKEYEVTGLHTKVDYIGEDFSFTSEDISEFDALFESRIREAESNSYYGDSIEFVEGKTISLYLLQPNDLTDDSLANNIIVAIYEYSYKYEGETYKSYWGLSARNVMYNELSRPVLVTDNINDLLNTYLWWLEPNTKEDVNDALDDLKNDERYYMKEIDF